MPNKLLLISAALFFTPPAAQAMDTLPSEVIERGVIPQMDRESLETYGSTNQKNAAAVKKYREDEAQPKDAIMACPTVSEVFQALKIDPSQGMSEEATIAGLSTRGDTTIGTQEWSVRLRRDSSPYTPTTLKETKLIRMEFIQEKEWPGRQIITCVYKIPQMLNSEDNTLEIDRTPLPSKWHILFDTCRPINPAYEGKMILMSEGADDGPFSLIPVSAEFLPEDAQVICAQQANIWPDEQ